MSSHSHKKTRKSSSSLRDERDLSPEPKPRQPIIKKPLLAGTREDYGSVMEDRDKKIEGKKSKSKKSAGLLQSEYTPKKKATHSTDKKASASSEKKAPFPLEKKLSLLPDKRVPTSSYTKAVPDKRGISSLDRRMSQNKKSASGSKKKIANYDKKVPLTPYREFAHGKKVPATPYREEMVHDKKRPGTPYRDEMEDEEELIFSPNREEIAVDRKMSYTRNKKESTTNREDKIYDQKKMHYKPDKKLGILPENKIALLPDRPPTPDRKLAFERKPPTPDRRMMHDNRVPATPDRRMLGTPMKDYHLARASISNKLGQVGGLQTKPGMQICRSIQQKGVVQQSRSSDDCSNSSNSSSDKTKAVRKLALSLSELELAPESERAKIKDHFYYPNMQGEQSMKTLATVAAKGENTFQAENAFKVESPAYETAQALLNNFMVPEKATQSQASFVFNTEITMPECRTASLAVNGTAVQPAEEIREETQGDMKAVSFDYEVFGKAGVYMGWNTNRTMEPCPEGGRGLDERKIPGKDFEAFEMMEEVLDKLKVLNYEKQYCQQLGFKYISRHYFALKKNSGEQFHYFTTLSAWLIQTLGKKFEMPHEGDDPNAVISMILDVIREQGISIDFPPSRLKAGSGISCVWVLNSLCEFAIRKSDFMWRRPVIPVEEDMTEYLMPNPNELTAEQAELDILEELVASDDEDDDEMIGLEELKKMGVQPPPRPESVLEVQTDQIDWKMELERVMPRLRVKINSKDQDWRMHMEKIHDHIRKVDGLRKDLTPLLTKLSDTVDKELQKIGAREKFIARTLDEEIGLLRVKKHDLYNETGDLVAAKDRVATLTQLTNKMSEQNLNVKKAMEQRGHLLTDGKPLLTLKATVRRMEFEIKHMGARISFCWDMLISAKLRDKREVSMALQRVAEGIQPIVYEIPLDEDSLNKKSRRLDRSRPPRCLQFDHVLSI